MRRVMNVLCDTMFLLVTMVWTGYTISQGLVWTEEPPVRVKVEYPVREMTPQEFEAKHCKPFVPDKPKVERLPPVEPEKLPMLDQEPMRIETVC